MEKALNWWMEARNRKCVLANGNELLQKAPSLYEDFSQGSPETSDTSHLLQLMGGHQIQEQVWTEKHKKYWCDPVSGSHWDVATVDGGDYSIFTFDPNTDMNEVCMLMIDEDGKQS